MRDAISAGIADGWADPARLSTEARRARALLDASREAIADAVGARPEYVHFAASPHDAFGRVVPAMAAARRGSDRIVVGATERDAVMSAVHYAAGDAVDVVPVDRLGHLDIEAFRAAVSGFGVALACVQHANQELGTVQRLERVAEAAATSRVPLVVDATASIGHIEPPMWGEATVLHPADWGGPAGIAVIVTTPQTRWLPTWPDGDGFSPGGVSVPLALASAVALQERGERRAEWGVRLHALIARIRERVAQLEGVDVLGDPDERLPHVLTFSCLYVDGEALLSELDRAGFAVGSGSACATGTLEPSRVLAAVGALTHGNVRLSLHPSITEADVEDFLAALETALATVRARLGAPRFDA